MTRVLIFTRPWCKPSGHRSSGNFATTAAWASDANQTASIQAVLPKRTSSETLGRQQGHSLKLPLALFSMLALRLTHHAFVASCSSQTTQACNRHVHNCYNTSPAITVTFSQAISISIQNSAISTPYTCRQSQAISTSQRAQQT